MVIISLGPEIDQRAWELREAGYTWDRVAQQLGVRSGSSARTAASRHARSLGIASGYVPPANRSTGLRTFGVEIEFVDLTRENACIIIEQALGIPHVHLMDYHGRDCYRCGNRVRGFREWKVERDGSVSSGEWGGEVVTPILKGEQGLEDITKVMRALRTAGGNVNQSCGMHVHLNVQSMTNAARAKLVTEFYKHHDTFDRFIAKSRTAAGRGQGYQYCERAADHEWQEQSRRMEANGHFGYTEKYRSLNLTPYAKYGTVEVRMHQGTLNARKATAWIQLLVGFLDTVEREEQDQFATGLALLGSLVDGNKIKQETAAYLMRRAEQLA